MKSQDNTYSAYKEIRNKKVLVTGVSGFIGSNLNTELLKNGAIVYGVSRRKKDRNILNSDLLDFRTLEKFIKKNNISICFHLAGNALVEQGQQDPHSTFSVNIQGTLNVLELARKYRFDRVIVASTSHVYGKNKLPYYEGYTPRPTRPYETSKACTDLIAQSYAETFDLPVFISRFVNIYGPGDLNFNRIIPRAIRHIYTNEPVNFWGGNAVRDYLYISDAVDGFMKLAVANKKVMDKNKIFNFGSGNPISVKKLIKELNRLSGKKLAIKNSTKRRELEISKQYVSFSKAKRLLSWQPNVSLDVGLLRSLDWYKLYFTENI